MGRARFPKADMQKQLGGIREARERRESGEREAAEFHRQTDGRRLEEFLARLDEADREAYRRRRDEWDRRGPRGLPREALGLGAPRDPEAKIGHRRRAAQGQLEAGRRVEAIIEDLAGAGATMPDDPVIGPVDREGLADRPDWRSIIADRIRDEDYSFNGLGVEAGVSAAVVMRFVKGERDIRLATAEKLCAALDLVLVPAEMVRDPGDAAVDG
jgi:hypothetical protein